MDIIWIKNLLNALIIFIVFINVNSYIQVLASVPNEVRAYCQGEKFKTNCSSDEVVIMKWAVYGRMRLETCVKKNMGHIGCQANVLDIADKKCSGRRNCEVSVPDVAFESTYPCLELQNYLEAAYTCHKVLPVNHNDCMNNRPLETIAPSGSIASITATLMYCGTRSSPWLIRGQTGQQINLTLVDFSASQNVTLYQQKNPVDFPITTSYLEANCQKYATIEEKGDGLFQDRVIQVCGRRQRNQDLYTSQGNVVQVSLEARRNNPDHFLINYEIIGCPDPSLPVNSWFKKESPNKATIWCKPTDEKWELTCQKGVWIGAYTNCSDVFTGENLGRASLDGQSTSRTILITMSVLLLIFIAFIIIVVVIVCRRYNYHHHPHHHHHHHQCDYPTPVSLKSKSSLYGASEDDLEHHHHHHHQHHSSSSYNARSLRYGHHHGHHHGQAQQYERSRRSESPCSRGGYSDYSAANYEKMDDDVIVEESPPVPPLPIKTKTSAKTSAVNLITSTGEKVTHIWEMPLPVPGK